jgi:rhodanese-related sulfurtransferase
MMEPQRITPDEAKRRMDTGERVVFLDTRSVDAWRKAELQIRGSRRIPPDEVQSRLGEIPRDGLVVTYCT